MDFGLIILLTNKEFMTLYFQIFIKSDINSLFVRFDLTHYLLVDRYASILKLFAFLSKMII